MKKQKEFKKIEPKKMPLKKILRLAIVLILILAAYLFLRNSRYFKLTRIEVIDKNRATSLKAGDLSTLYKGRNIFDIDIRSISSGIKSDYPTIKDAVVKRVLPNRLEIDIITRVPIAKIKGRRYFPIDRTGMVLSPKIKSQKLPVITGFTMWGGPKVGERLKDRRLESAIFLIDALEASSVSLDYYVATINVSNYKNLSFYLENGIEVKIGGEDFPDRLKMLKATLAKPDLDKKNIRYIDLRFKDVVIGPK